MIIRRMFAGTGPLAGLVCVGATAIIATGLALAGAGTASADDGKLTHHVVVSTAKDVEHIVVGTAKDLRQALRGTARDATEAIGGLKRNLGSFDGVPFGGAPTAGSHPINTRSLQQIQALQAKAINLTVIIQQAGIDNNNAVAALRELQQEQQILIKANTLASGIQNNTIPNTQETQVRIYIGQAQALQAQAHARFRNNIN